MFGGKIVIRICCLYCFNVFFREEVFIDFFFVFSFVERCRRRRLGLVMFFVEDIGVRDFLSLFRV